MLHSRVLAVVLVVSFALPIAAMGAGTAVGLVETTWVTQTHFVLKIAGSVTTPPACSIYGRFAIALNTDFGIAVMQAALAAQTSGRSLGVVGTGTCSTLSQNENVFYVFVSGPTAPPAPPTPTEFWATSAGTMSCAEVCKAARGIAVASSSGYVCKDSYSALQKREFWQALGGYYSCDGSRTSQCRCIPSSN